jgi:hypothetical protein
MLGREKLLAAVRRMPTDGGWIGMKGLVGEGSV